MKRRSFCKSLALLPFAGTAALTIFSKPVLKSLTPLDRVGTRRLILVIKKQMVAVAGTLNFKNGCDAESIFFAKMNEYMASLKDRKAVKNYKIYFQTIRNFQGIYVTLTFQPHNSVEELVLDMTACAAA